MFGKWKVHDSDHVIEIRANRDWVEARDKDAQVTSCKWEWDGTNRIRVTAQSKLAGKASGVMKVALNGDKLVKARLQKVPQSKGGAKDVDER